MWRGGKCSINRSSRADRLSLDARKGGENSLIASAAQVPHRGKKTKGKKNPRVAGSQYTGYEAGQEQKAKTRPLKAAARGGLKIRGTSIKKAGEAGGLALPDLRRLEGPADHNRRGGATGVTGGKDGIKGKIRNRSILSMPKQLTRTITRAGEGSWAKGTGSQYAQRKKTVKFV